MPDLMKTPSNRRYVVNFQNKEPKNKYDIWLSFNKHEQGNQVIVDSEHLSDKDLVFKVYMNGKWVPILGIPISYEGIIQTIEELDKKKMNIVPNFINGHIPIFQQGTNDCDQLIDGGTIESLIENAIQNIINNGGSIPIQRATTTKLGGIKADIHDTTQITDQYVEAKFKGAEGVGENDRLYISASEIIQAINTYIGGGGTGLDLQLMGPNTRGGAKANAVPVSWNPDKYIPILINQTNEHMYINGDDILSALTYILENDPLTSIYEEGEGIDITDNVISLELAEDSHIGGIKARPHGRQFYAASGNPAVEACIVEDDTPVFLMDVLYNNRIIPPRHLAITKGQIYALLNYQDEYTAPMFRSGFGIQPRAWHEYNTHTGVYDDWYTFDLMGHEDSNNWGKILKIADDGSGIEWIPVPTGGQSYDPLSANSVYGTNYVVAAPAKKEGYLKWDGTFDMPPTGDTISITPAYTTGTLIASYTLNGRVGEIYAPTSGSTYYPGDGILIDRNNYISIDTTNARDGWVLGYNSSTPGVEWVPQTSYTAGVGINIDATEKKIEARIIESRSLIPSAATYLMNFRAAQSQAVRNGIYLFIDAANPVILEPYTYTNLCFKPDPLLSEYELIFEIQDQPGMMYGNPVYCILQIDGKPDAVTVKVNTTELSGTGLININEAVVHDVQNDRSKLNPYCNHYLITMQFGIVKIEPLEATIVSSDNDGGDNTLEPAG